MISVTKQVHGGMRHEGNWINWWIKLGINIALL